MLIIFIPIFETVYDEEVTYETKYNHYWRYVYYSDHLWIDVGSWSEFFTIYPENEEEKKELAFG